MTKAISITITITEEAYGLLVLKSLALGLTEDQLAKAIVEQHFTHAPAAEAPKEDNQSAVQADSSYAAKVANGEAVAAQQEEIKRITRECQKRYIEEEKAASKISAQKAEAEAQAKREKDEKFKADQKQWIRDANKSMSHIG